jgi:hypothetical protein
MRPQLLREERVRGPHEGATGRGVSALCLRAAQQAGSGLQGHALQNAKRTHNTSQSEEE